MKFCTKCGNELLDEAVVCMKCGCAVQASAPVNTPVKSVKAKKAEGSATRVETINVGFCISVMVFLFLHTLTSFIYMFFAIMALLASIVVLTFGIIGLALSAPNQECGKASTQSVMNFIIAIMIFVLALSGVVF